MMLTDQSLWKNSLKLSTSITTLWSLRKSRLLLILKLNVMLRLSSTKRIKR